MNIEGLGAPVLVDYVERERRGELISVVGCKGNDVIRENSCARADTYLVSLLPGHYDIYGTYKGSAGLGTFVLVLCVATRCAALSSMLERQRNGLPIVAVQERRVPLEPEKVISTWNFIW